MKKGLRRFLFLALTLALCAGQPGFAEASGEAEPNNLRFNADGKFKIMQMSDIQDYIKPGERDTIDPRTIALMNAALDAEKPDLVVITGDHIGGDMNAQDLQAYYQQMVAPLEERQIPWLVTYGNHDEDAVTAMEEDGWNKIKQLEYMRSFEHNINRPSMSGVEGYAPNGVNTHCVGDMYQLIYDSTGETPLYTLWALDTNSYEVPDNGFTGYDWPRPEQVSWYYNTALRLRETYGVENAVMFTHIPTPEFAMMYAEKDKYGVVGSRYGTEFSTEVNSGLFSAVQLAGDVRGIFIAHAHENDYVGNYHGVYLGFDGNVGYCPYGPDMFEGMLGFTDLRDLLRGVRVVELDQRDLAKLDTRMVYATDLGVNCTTKELGEILRLYGQFAVELIDKAGVEVVGWSHNEAGEVIYVNPTGEIQRSWRTIAGQSTYYFNSEGVMQTGWQTIDGKTYYFYEDGTMAKDTTIDDFVISADGVRA